MIPFKENSPKSEVKITNCEIELPTKFSSAK